MARSTAAVVVLSVLVACSTAEAGTAGVASNLVALLAKAEAQASFPSGRGVHLSLGGPALTSANYPIPGLNSTVDGPAAPASIGESGSGWNMPFCLCALVIVGLGPVLVQNKGSSLIVVLVYLASLTLVQVLVVVAVQHGMPYPYSIALLHVFCSMVISAAWERPRLQDALTVLPVSVMDSLSLVLGNMALVVGGVPLAAKLSCCTPASTVMVEELSGRQCAPVRVLMVVALVVVGSMLCTKGVAIFTMVPLLLAVAACVSRSLKCLWEYDLLEAKVPPLSLVAWSSFWSIMMLLPLVAYFEGAAALTSFTSASKLAQLAVVASALLGMALHISQCLAIQQLGPLTQSTVLNLHYVLAILSASAWLQEEVTSAQWVGTVVLVLGASLTQSQPASLPGKQGNRASLSELLAELC